MLWDELLLSPFRQQLSPQSEDGILSPMHSALPEIFEQCSAPRCFSVVGTRLFLQRRDQQDSPGQASRTSLQPEPTNHGESSAHLNISVLLKSCSAICVENSEIQVSSIIQHHFSILVLHGFLGRKKMHSILIDCLRKTNLS